MSDVDHEYPFDNALAGQRARLAALEAVFDDGSFRRLAERGLAPGWRCLEVGAGGGSVARWLVERVGPDGSVLATDLDVTALRDVRHPRLEVRRHDVLRDPLPSSSFDVVHVRFVLAWLADPALAVRRLVAALKPGGWLVAEELDFASVVADPAMEPDSAALFGRVHDAHLELLTERAGFDPGQGRRLQALLDNCGLTDVDAAGSVTIWRGGEPGGRLWELTFKQLRDSLIATGRVSGPDVDRAIGLCREGLSFQSPTVMTAWGRAST